MSETTNFIIDEQKKLDTISLNRYTHTFTPFKTTEYIEKGFRTRYDIPAWKEFLIDFLKILSIILFLVGIVSLFVFAIMING